MPDLRCQGSKLATPLTYVPAAAHSTVCAHPMARAYAMLASSEPIVRWNGAQTTVLAVAARVYARSHWDTVCAIMTTEVVIVACHQIPVYVVFMMVLS